MKNPWKSLASYEVKDARYFKGREKSIAKFVNIMDNGTMSVLYASSGIGKTSFINAGIVPIFIERGYFPIHILFPDKVYEKDELKKWLNNFLREDICFDISETSKVLVKTREWKPIFENNDNLIKTSKQEEIMEECDQSLWWLLHAHRLTDVITGQPIKPLLIFDQFEEIFVKSGHNKLFLQHFFQLIGELSSGMLPKEIAESIEQLANEGVFIDLDTVNSYKVIFSLRKEFLSEFDFWTNDRNSITDLYQNRMLLLPLTRHQAERVICEQPTSTEVTTLEYVSTLTLVKDVIIDEIDKKGSDEIEPFILSVVCSQLYDKAQKEGKLQLEKTDVVSIDITSEISHFYSNILQNLLRDHVFKNIRDIERFEDLFVSVIDGHRKRKSYRDDKSLRDFVKTSPTILDSLENVHLIRRNVIGDDVDIELVHDKLAEVIHHKQLQRQEKKNIILWYTFWGLAFLSIFLFAWWYSMTSDKDNGSPYSEITNRVTDTEKLFPISFVSSNNFYEQININSDTTDYKFDSWSSLNTIKVNKEYTDLNLSITECPQLRNIELNQSLDNVSISIERTPFAKIYIGPQVQTLKIYCSEDNLRFNINNKRYQLLSNYQLNSDTTNFGQNPYDKTIQKDYFYKILWDNEKQEAIYASCQQDTFSFPKEIGNKEFFWYRWKKYVNRDIVSQTVCDTISKYHVTDEDVNIYASSIYLSDSVKTIGNKAFAKCKNLRKIRFSDSLKCILSHAFEGLNKLDTLFFPPSLQLIGESAFRDCKGLKFVSFNNGCLTLGDNSFSSCSSLECVVLPDSLSSRIYSTHHHPFTNCPRLKKVIQRNCVKTNLMIRDKVVCDKKNGYPIIVLSDYCKFNFSPFYSENGIIYKSNEYGHDEIVYIPLKANFRALLNRSNQYIASKNWIVDVINKEIFDVGSSPEFAFPIVDERVFGNYSFSFPPDSLKCIIIPFPQPDNGDWKEFSFNIDEKLKASISIVVPYGCKKYYENNPNYVGFKSIEEDHWWKRYTNYFAYCWFMLKLYSGGLGRIVLLIISIISFVISCYRYKLKDLNTKNKIIDKKLLWLHSVMEIAMAWLIYGVIYWSFFSIWTNKGEIKEYQTTSIIALPLAAFLWFLVFRKEKFASRVEIIWNMIPKPSIRLQRYNWRKVFVISAFVIFCSVLIWSILLVNNFDKMMACGNYKRATILVFDKIMSKDSITNSDFSSLREVTERAISYQQAETLLTQNVLNIELLKKDSLMLIYKENKVALLNLKTDQLSEYNIPSINQKRGSLISNGYICFLTLNCDSAYICKIGSPNDVFKIKAKYVNIVDNGNILVSRTDTMLYVYDIKERPTLKRIIKYNNSKMSWSEDSKFIALKKDSITSVFDLTTGKCIARKILKGKYLHDINNNMLVTYDYEPKESYVYSINENLRLLYKMRGIPVSNDLNEDCQFKTYGNNNFYYYSISISGIRADSIPSSSKYNKISYHNSISNFVHKYHNSIIADLVFCSKDKLLYYNDSLQTITTYDVKHGNKPMLVVRGKRLGLTEDGEFFYIEDREKDSLYIYNMSRLLYKSKVDSWWDSEIMDNYLLERNKDNRVTIKHFCDLHHPILVSNDKRLYQASWNNFHFFDGVLYIVQDDNLYRVNIYPINQLIELNPYWTKRQKQDLLRKLDNQKN